MFLFVKMISFIKIVLFFMQYLRYSFLNNSSWVWVWVWVRLRPIDLVISIIGDVVYKVFLKKQILRPNDLGYIQFC